MNFWMNLLKTILRNRLRNYWWICQWNLKKFLMDCFRYSRWGCGKNPWNVSLWHSWRYFFKRNLCSNLGRFSKGIIKETFGVNPKVISEAIPGDFLKEFLKETLRKLFKIILNSYFFLNPLEVFRSNLLGDFWKSS